MTQWVSSLWLLLLSCSLVAGEMQHAVHDQQIHQGGRTVDLQGGRHLLHDTSDVQQPPKLPASTTAVTHLEAHTSNSHHSHSHPKVSAGSPDTAVPGISKHEGSFPQGKVRITAIASLQPTPNGHPSQDTPHQDSPQPRVSPHQPRVSPHPHDLHHSGVPVTKEKQGGLGHELPQESGSVMPQYSCFPALAAASLL